VVFNDRDVTADVTAVIPGELSEEEKEKIIQVPKNNAVRTDETTASKPQLENTSGKSDDPEAQNTVPFPSVPEVLDVIPSKSTETTTDDEPQSG
jgi:hypothetical protein